MYDTDDDLDRAILALPLEPAPPGLRASILSAIATRPEPILTTWETVGVGIILALGAWLVLLLASSHVNSAAIVSSMLGIVARYLAGPSTLVWLAVGMGCALCLSLFSVPRRQTVRS